MFDRFFRKAPAGLPTLEQKLDILARGGIKLQTPFTAADLLDSWPRADFEKEGFELLLAALGAAEERPPWRRYSANVWHFDFECIEGEGSYTHIGETMAALAQGSLPLQEIHDYVDQEAGEAWLAFHFRGQPIRIECKVNEDWADPTLFVHFVELLGQSDPSKIYLSYHAGGHDCVLACVTKAESALLKKAGIPFQPLR